jgi:hypothetical protein
VGIARMSDDKMMNLYAKEYRHGMVVELVGTKKYPVYYMGFSESYHKLFPVTVETYAFTQNQDGSYSSLFAYAMRNPIYKDTLFSLFFVSDDEQYEFGKCRFVKEVEKEKIPLGGKGVETLSTFGMDVWNPVRIAFDMFWEEL